jgi:hypothetical protein
MQCILCKIYFWKVFHKYYNFIYTPICTKFLFLQKVGVTVSKTTCKNDDKNQVKEQFIFSQAFHQTPDERVRKNTTGEQLRPENLKLFDPVAQARHQQPPASNQHRERKDPL